MKWQASGIWATENKWQPFQGSKEGKKHRGGRIGKPDEDAETVSQYCHWQIDCQKTFQMR